MYSNPKSSSQIYDKKWDEINDDARGTYNKNIQIKFKASVLKWSLCDYIDAHILLSGTITIDEEGDNESEKQADKKIKE